MFFDFKYIFLIFYFTSVVPTGLSLQCNWPITGIQGSYKPARFKEVHSKLHLFQASFCTLTATHLSLIFVYYRYHLTRKNYGVFYHDWGNYAWGKYGGISPKPSYFRPYFHL